MAFLWTGIFGVKRARKPVIAEDSSRFSRLEKGRTKAGMSNIFSFFSPKKRDFGSFDSLQKGQS
jgi:hypothetical protein